MILMKAKHHLDPNRSYIKAHAKDVEAKSGPRLIGQNTVDNANPISQNPYPICSICQKKTSATKPGLMPQYLEGGNVVVCESCRFKD